MSPTYPDTWFAFLRKHWFGEWLAIHLLQSRGCWTATTFPGILASRCQGTEFRPRACSESYNAPSSLVQISPTHNPPRSLFLLCPVGYQHRPATGAMHPRWRSLHQLSVWTTGAHSSLPCPASLHLRDVWGHYTWGVTVVVPPTH